MSSSIEYIDIHGHLNFADYDLDREEAIKRSVNANIGMITVGTDIKSSQEAVELAEKYETMWACIGIHPNDTNNISDNDFSKLRILAENRKVVAIGECGLDYFHSAPEDIEKQREVFIKHIELANELNKPLMLHVRNSKTGNDLVNGSQRVDAYQEVLGILKSKAKVRANFHFFAGNVEVAQEIVAMGNMVSFTGVLSFARNYDEIIRGIPLSSIMSETDCPFVAPIPYRGKRNEPLYVKEVVRKISEIRNEDPDTVARQLIENARTFFGLNC